MLRYGGGFAVHTASSGRVEGLDTLYLRLRDSEGAKGVGEVRINVAYLNGYDPDVLAAEARALVPTLDFTGDPLTLLAAPPVPLVRATAPIRMLVDLALHDLAARRRSIPLAELLGAPSGESITYRTNQTLFLADEATFLARAVAYVERGFRDLKVRIGSADFVTDLSRIRALRAAFGKDVELAADANGAWDVEEARRRLEMLAPYELAYVEQPVAPRPLAEIVRLAETTPIPIMLDESVRSEADVAELAGGGHRLSAHLKLVKLGGIAPAKRAAERLSAAGVPVMIGQMNEGAVATAAALHLAAAVKPRFAELYGADGLLNDPAAGLSYRDGSVSAPSEPGFGLSFAPEHAERF